MSASKNISDAVPMLATLRGKVESAQRNLTDAVNAAVESDTTANLKRATEAITDVHHALAKLREMESSVCDALGINPSLGKARW